MILVRFFGSFFHSIEKTMDESASLTEDPKKSCKGSSIFKGSLKSSKSKLDEFFKRKDHDLKRKAKKLKKDASEQMPQKFDKKRKLAKMAEFLSPILSLGKPDGSAQKYSHKEVHGSKRSKGGSCDKLNSASFKRQNPYWHTSLAKCDLRTLNKQQLDRQEAIFELYRSEIDLIEDLQMICKTYRDTMLKLNLISANEAAILFSDIHLLIPIHQELVDNLEIARLSDGRTEDVGSIIINWVPTLAVYILYCTSLLHSKELFDHKMRQDFGFRDFQERCLSCPFSRKLDLWTFLDVPRSKLVKYPLLLRSILKHTPLEHQDHLLLCESLEIVEEVLRDVDYNAGRARCQLVIDKLEYEDHRQRHQLIQESSFIICEGILRTRKGLKLHVFLLDKILVLTRPYHKTNSSSNYKIYKRPIPLSDLYLVEPSYPSPVKEGRNGRVLDDKRREQARSSVCLERKDSGFCSSRTSALSFRSVLSSLSQHSRTSLTSGLSLSSFISCADDNIELINCDGWNVDEEVSSSVHSRSRCILRADNELDRQHWLKCLRGHVAGILFPDCNTCVLERRLPAWRRCQGVVHPSVSSGRLEESVRSKNREGRFEVCPSATQGGTLERGIEMNPDGSISTVSSYSSFVSVFSESSNFVGKENFDLCSGDDGSMAIDIGRCGLVAGDHHRLERNSYHGNTFAAKFRFLHGDCSDAFVSLVAESGRVSRF